MTANKPSINPTWIDAKTMFLEVNPASQPLPTDDGGLENVLREILNERGIEGAEAEQIIRPNRDSKEDERTWSLVCEIQERKARLLELGKFAPQSNTERIATWDYEKKLQDEIEKLELELRGASVVGSTPAPHPGLFVQPEAIGSEMLATPEQLIQTFEHSTGMCKAWFDNLTDTPRLLAARKVAGTGGKHHTPPLFCPFEVMQWLIDKKRKKGRKVSEEKAWQLLQSGFEKVYNTRSVGDPR